MYPLPYPFHIGFITQYHMTTQSRKLLIKLKSPVTQEPYGIKKRNVLLGIIDRISATMLSVVTLNDVLLTIVAAAAVILN
jgi:hypothetical protein